MKSTSDKGKTSRDMGDIVFGTASRIVDLGRPRPATLALLGNLGHASVSTNSVAFQPMNFYMMKRLSHVLNSWQHFVIASRAGLRTANAECIP